MERERLRLFLQKRIGAGEVVPFVAGQGAFDERPPTDIYFAERPAGGRSLSGYLPGAQGVPHYWVNVAASDGAKTTLTVVGEVVLAVRSDQPQGYEADVEPGRGSITAPEVFVQPPLSGQVGAMQDGHIHVADSRGVGSAGDGAVEVDAASPWPKTPRSPRTYASRVSDAQLPTSSVSKSTSPLASYCAHSPSGEGLTMLDQDSTRGTFAFSTGPAGHRGPEGLQGQVGEG